MPGPGSPEPGERQIKIFFPELVTLFAPALQDDKIVRQVLNALALKLDGTAASPDYLGRRRRVLYNTIYAKCIHGRDQVWYTLIDRALNQG